MKHDPLALPLLIQGLGPTQLKCLVSRLIDLYLPPKEQSWQWLEEQVADIKRTRPEPAGSVVPEARCPRCKEYFDLLLKGDTDCPHCGHDGRE